VIRQRMAQALIGAGVLAVMPAAYAKDADVPAYALTASNIATAIYKGDDVSRREDMFALSPAEYTELAKLKGCTGEIQPSAQERAVLIAWTCGEGTDDPGLKRSVFMMFEENGRLVQFGINAPLNAMAPTPASMETNKRPFPRRFAAQIGDAITKARDPSLGGLVALTAFDRDRLALFQGGSYWVLEPHVRSTLPEVAEVKRVHLRDATSTHRQIVHIYFDAEDRPLGLAFAPSTDPGWQETARRSAAVATGDPAAGFWEADMASFGATITRRQ
jgi:hypothetical protein